MFHKRLLKEFRENRKYVAGMVFTQWIALMANVLLTLALAYYIAALLTGGAQEADTTGLILCLGTVFMIRTIAHTANSRMSHKASKTVKEGLRERITEKLMLLGPSYRDTAATSEVVQISTEGVDQLEIYFGKYIPQFFYSLLAPLTLFLIVAGMSIRVAAALLICVPLIPLSIVAVQKFAKKLLAKYWGTYTGLGDSFLENLQGLLTLKIYQADGRYAEKMDEEAEKFRKVTMRVLIMQLNSISIMDLIAYGGAAAGILLSVMELNAGRITVSECLFIILVSAEFFLPLRLLGSFFHIAMNGNAAADKIFRLLDAPAPDYGKESAPEGDAVSFSDVSYSYPGGKQVLNHISFEIPARSFTAIVGESGCGKSTAASLIMGKLRTGAKGGSHTGRITIGGVETELLSEDAFYQKITCVRHDSYVFTGTVLENLKMGNPNAGIREMEEALKQVDLYDTVMKKGGLSMPVTEKASNLSGGQKQRLALARAILHDSDVYIFDEATSNVDAESENKIMEAIRRLAGTKTVILISHRLFNVMEADQILVMKDGRIAERGRHRELLKCGCCYRSLFTAQQELERYAGAQEPERKGA